MVPHFVTVRSEVHFDKAEKLGQKDARALRTAQLRAFKHIYKELRSLHEFAKVRPLVQAHTIFDENRTKCDPSEKGEGAG